MATRCCTITGLAEWLTEWAKGNARTTYLDVLLETGRVTGSFPRTTKGKALRHHLLGSERAPISAVVAAAIAREGSAASLAERLEPIIRQGMHAPYSSLATALAGGEAAVTANAVQVSLPKESLLLTVCPTAFTFVPGKMLVWEAPEAMGIGVYLWCLEYEGAYLVNYVGKAGGQGGFAQRLRTEVRQYKAGIYRLNYPAVDLNAWKHGVRRLLPGAMTREQLDYEVKEILPLYRILLVPLSSDDEARKVESTLISRLRDHRHQAVRQFLANNDKRNHKPKVEIEFGTGCHRIIGLTAPAPNRLLEAVQRAER